MKNIKLHGEHKIIYKLPIFTLTIKEQTGNITHFANSELTLGIETLSGIR